jgi:hypothetical protein
MASSLIALKENIEKLNKFHQIEVLKILRNDESCTLNENKNGVFINLTNVNEKIIFQMEGYLEYVKKQEEQLNDIEEQKDMLSNTFFKDIKDNNDNKDSTSISINAEI